MSGAGTKPQPDNAMQGAFPDLSDGGNPLRVVAVDLKPELVDHVRARIGTDVRTADFAALDIGFLARTTPDIVLAHLFGGPFDILDLAERLIRMGFGGRLYALTAPLPNAGAVLDELRREHPGIAIDLIVLNDKL